MKMAKRILAVVMAALMAVAVFAGCSKNADDANKTTEKVKVINIDLSDEVYALGVNKEDAELLAKTNEFIDKILKDGTFDEICTHYFGDGEPVGVTSAVEDASKDQLVVATNAEFEPFEFKKGDQFYGIDMEVVKALADSLGKELVIKDMKFDAVVLSVQQGKADIAAAGLTVTEDRAAQVNFSNSYYAASQRVVVKGDDTTFDACQTKADVDKILNALDASAKIGGQNGTTGQYYVEGSADFGFEKLPATFVGYDNGSLAIQDLINGNVKYVIIDAAPASAITTAINAVA